MLLFTFCLFLVVLFFCFLPPFLPCVLLFPVCLQYRPGVTMLHAPGSGAADAEVKDVAPSDESKQLADLLEARFHQLQQRQIELKRAQEEFNKEREEWRRQVCVHACACMCACACVHGSVCRSSRVVSCFRASLTLCVTRRLHVRMHV